MRNIIVGTSGHVDHGKTCLIRALTGMETDRLQEEKKRGITIENGFADFLYGDYNISIIDVPGHERFVSNMLMGIGGIDLVLLVIGLDEGVMPQTVEHFRITQMLGIDRGIIVFTKKDLADDEDWIEMVKEDARELVKGSFLEGAPEAVVSAFDGTGIEELKAMIVETAASGKLKNDSDNLFRLPVDRVFTIEGFGTVITGTLLEGQVKQGQDIMIYPEGKKARVRNVQVHNENVPCAYAGQRTAINLQGVKKEEISKGSVLAIEDSITPTMMVDCSLTMFKDAKKNVLNGSRVHFHCGACETLAKVVLLDRDVLEKGETAYCQLRFEESLPLKRDDRFIIRFYSPLISIGGGKIIEENPFKHKRNDERVLKTLAIKDKGDIADIAAAIISENSFAPLTPKEVMQKLKVSPAVWSKCEEEILERGLAVKMKGDIFLHRDYLEGVKNKACEILDEYHKQNQMSAGLGSEEFRSRLGTNARIRDKKLVAACFAYLLETGVIKEKDNHVSLAGFEMAMPPEMMAMKKRLQKLYSEKGYEMPTLDDALATEKDKKNATHIIDAMAASGELVRLNYIYYIDGRAFDAALEKIRQHVKAEGKITLAQFRDIIGTSRKYAMAILDYLDEKEITVKIDDYRVLKGD